MTSSGTYGFLSTNGELVLAAYERIGIRAPSLRQEHMVSAKRELNYLFVEWSNKQVNLWKVIRTQTVLTPGTGTYSVPSNTIMILDASVVTNFGTQQESRVYVTPISRTEYLSFGNLQIQGYPTVYWFDRLIAPTVTFWPIPDNGGPYTWDFFSVTQMQDANLAGGEIPDVPYRWLDAIASGLAHRLSRIYGTPEMEQVRAIDAKSAWDAAAAQDTENVGFMLAPALGLYYR